MKSTYILATFFALLSGGAFAQSLEDCAALEDPLNPDAACTLGSMEGTCSDDALCADGCNNELLDEGLCLLDDCYCFNAQPVDNGAQKCSEVTSEQDPFGSCSLNAMQGWCVDDNLCDRACTQQSWSNGSCNESDKNCYCSNVEV